MDSTIVNFYLIFRRMPSNMPDLALLFNPSSVAVIGESSDRNKLSGRTIHFRRLTTRRRSRCIKPLVMAGR